jgi:DNA-directed RNA polymerase I, II, and III subunit RPABC2
MSKFIPVIKKQTQEIQQRQQKQEKTNIDANLIIRGKKVKISNEALNIYINDQHTNDQHGGKKNKTNNSTSNLNDTLDSENNSVSNTDDNSDSENNSESDSENISITSVVEVDPNDEPLDEYEIIDDIEETEPNIEVSDEVDFDDVDETDGKIMENNDIDNENEFGEDDANNNDAINIEDCLYQIDDLVSGEDEEIKQTPSNERITDPFLTHYERVRVSGIRTKQIAMSAKPMVKSDKFMSAIELAKYELVNNMCPLQIKRTLPDRTYEMWNVRELSINDDNMNNISDMLDSDFEANNDKFKVNHFNYQNDLL